MQLSSTSSTQTKHCGKIAGPIADKTGQDIREIIYQIQINNDLGPNPTLKPGQRLVIRY